MSNPTELSWRQTLLQELQGKLIPWAQEGAPLAWLAPPPLVPAGITIHARPAAPLIETRAARSQMLLCQWPEEQMQSMRVPYLGCVTAGEADLKTATVIDREPRPSDSPAQSTLAQSTLGRWTIELPARTFFLFPPGAPMPDSRLHWERAHPERAHSRLFWIHILPSGALCHSCQCEGGRHFPHPHLFVPDAHLAALMNVLLEEYTAREGRFEIIARAQLVALLLRLERGLRLGYALRADAPQREARSLADEKFALQNPGKPNDAQDDVPALSLRRACDYIHAHLNEPLSPALVARHSYVSVAHLNRLFRAELQMPVMQYVTRRRLELAQSLLCDTNLTVVEIAHLCGYFHPSHFSRAFARHAQMPPGEYRKRHHATQRV